MRTRSAFTLVELLVVIAIITTLLAILMPSIGRAMYASQVAVCAANLRQIGVGTLSYASDNFTFYPHSADPSPYSSVPVYDGIAYRPAFKPWLIASKSQIDGYFDLIPIWKPYFAGDMSGVFICPMIENDWNAGGNGKFPWWHTNAGLQTYSLMFNAAYGGALDKPMRRMGERWRQAVSNSTQVGTRGQYYNILASDTACRQGTGPMQRGNHPSYGAGGTFGAIANGHGTGMTTGGTLNASYLTDDGATRNFDRIDYRDNEKWGGATAFFLVPAELASTDPGPR